MDAKEYMMKVKQICDSVECGECPLVDLSCGYPISELLINKSIEIVEKYQLEEE
ncbi:MAG: hypothetical protein ABFD00_04985 [Chloroherpetonaceae bacterium]